MAVASLLCSAFSKVGCVCVCVCVCVYMCMCAYVHVRE